MTAEALELAFEGSPYGLTPEGVRAVGVELDRLSERVRLIRSVGRLSSDTLKRYYGLRRFEHVAQSNAIEGSTLSVGETELAVMKGVTLTGHNPRFVRDAVSLDKALQRVVALAQKPGPTHFSEASEFHGLLFEGVPGAGMFRRDPVRIRGSEHRPPRSWSEVMSAMEGWQEWSVSQAGAHPLLRAAILHAWLVHIHPFSDGNGRTARAVTTLELARARFPTLIIRRGQDRTRYISALRRSDAGGDIGGFLALIFERFEGALLGLEGAAAEMEGYSPALARAREAQGRKLGIWNKSVELLYQRLVDRLADRVEQAGGHLRSRLIDDALELDEYVELCQGRAVGKSWAFEVQITVPGRAPVTRLAWVGFRSPQMLDALNSQDLGPSLYWSRPNPGSYPPWIQCEEDSPGVSEMTTPAASDDNWHGLTSTGEYWKGGGSELVAQVAAGFMELLAE